MYCQRGEKFVLTLPMGPQIDQEVQLQRLLRLSTVVGSRIDHEVQLQELLRPVGEIRTRLQLQGLLRISEEALIQLAMQEARQIYPNLSSFRVQ